jgi:hypothetical protein
MHQPGSALQISPSAALVPDPAVDPAPRQAAIFRHPHSHPLTTHAYVHLLLHIFAFAVGIPIAHNVELRLTCTMPTSSQTSDPLPPHNEESRLDFNRIEQVCANGIFANHQVNYAFWLFVF